MTNRPATTHSTAAARRWALGAIVALATIAAATAPITNAEAKAARPVWTAAPRDAGEPIMGIVSIKTQQVTFYDADGWILRAPV
ncbi:MAG TPA: L,D-transpeptidase, partial [Bauldia sp.]|nr:L,D-transpeptidase [Bauldia sp.]